MANEIVSYLEMSLREGMSLQKGMNFRTGGAYSVILMSLRPDAPYRDRIEDDGETLIYEGHNASRRYESNPESVDQPEFNPTGSMTENGKFHRIAQDFKQGLIRQPHKVRVYEKIRAGIWSYNGLFDLVDSWRERSENRVVFKFKLIPSVDSSEETAVTDHLAPGASERTRIIPSHVKLGGLPEHCG